MDPVSMTAGVAGITTFTVKAVVNLIQIVRKIQDANAELKALHDDLQGLQIALNVLQNLLTDYADDFVLLEVPLKCCYTMCESFRKVVQGVEASSRLASWAKLQMKESEIVTIRGNLTLWKSTITIVIGGLNLRQHAATQQLVSEYQTLVIDTNSAVRERLEQLKISSKAGGSVLLKDGNTELSPEQTLQEKLNAEACLEICHAASMKLLQLSGSASHSGGPQASVQMTKQNFDRAREELQQLKKQYDEQLLKLGASEDIDEETLAQMKKAFAQTLSICERGLHDAASARVNEYVGIAGGARAHQYIMSTVGDLLHVTDAKVEDDGLQVIGQVDGDVVRHISTDYAKTRVLTKDGLDAEYSTNSKTPAFSSRHGDGTRLGRQ